MKHLWFKAKHYGYGWYPATWEGFLVLFVFLFAVLLPPGVAIMLGVRRHDQEFAMLFIPYVAVLLILLLWICVKKGEKARWRWGK